MEIFFHILRHKYCVFSGRASRKEFWFFCASSLACAKLFVLFAMLTFLKDPATGFAIAGGLLFFPLLGTTIRRLHDVGRPGWFLLLALIPIAGILILLGTLALEGNSGENSFGPKEPVPDLLT